MGNRLDDPNPKKGEEEKYEIKKKKKKKFKKIDF